MSSGDLKRLRSDLSTVRSALALDRAWSDIDVAFLGAIAATFALYALLRWPGGPLEVAGRLAGVPMLAAFAAYFVYMAVRTRSLPPREESRRREYRSTLVAALIAVPASFLYLAWGKQAGMTGLQLRGTMLVLIGIALLVIGVAQPPLRYPRSSFIVGSVPLIAFGLAIPLAPPAYYDSLIGLLGLTALGLTALALHWHLRQNAQTAEGGPDVGH